MASRRPTRNKGYFVRIIKNERVTNPRITYLLLIYGPERRDQGTPMAARSGVVIELDKMPRARGVVCLTEMPETSKRITIAYLHRTRTVCRPFGFLEHHSR